MEFVLNLMEFFAVMKFIGWEKKQTNSFLNIFGNVWQDYVKLVIHPVTHLDKTSMQIVKYSLVIKLWRYWYIWIYIKMHYKLFLTCSLQFCW
jgi:hypothetical protein